MGVVEGRRRQDKADEGPTQVEEGQNGRLQKSQIKSTPNNLLPPLPAPTSLPPPPIHAPSSSYTSFSSPSSPIASSPPSLTEYSSPELSNNSAVSYEPGSHSIPDDNDDSRNSPNGEDSGDERLGSNERRQHRRRKHSQSPKSYPRGQRSRSSYFRSRGETSPQSNAGQGSQSESLELPRTARGSSISGSRSGSRRSSGNSSGSNDKRRNSSGEVEGSYTEKSTSSCKEEGGDAEVIGKAGRQYHQHRPRRERSDYRKQLSTDRRGENRRRSHRRSNRYSKYDEESPEARYDGSQDSRDGKRRGGDGSRRRRRRHAAPEEDKRQSTESKEDGGVEKSRKKSSGQKGHRHDHRSQWHPHSSDGAKARRSSRRTSEAARKENRPDRRRSQNHRESRLGSQEHINSRLDPQQHRSSRVGSQQHRRSRLVNSHGQDATRSENNKKGRHASCMGQPEEAPQVLRKPSTAAEPRPEDLFARRIRKELFLKAVMTVQRVFRGFKGRQAVGRMLYARVALRDACLGVAMNIIESFIREDIAPPLITSALNDGLGIVFEPARRMQATLLGQEVVDEVVDLMVAGAVKKAIREETDKHLDIIFVRDRRNPLLVVVDDIIAEALRASSREVAVMAVRACAEDFLAGRRVFFLVDLLIEQEITEFIPSIASNAYYNHAGQTVFTELEREIVGEEAVSVVAETMAPFRDHLVYLQKEKDVAAIQSAAHTVIVKGLQLKHAARTLGQRGRLVMMSDVNARMLSLLIAGRFLATLKAAEENRLQISTSPLLFLLFRRLVTRSGRSVLLEELSRELDRDETALHKLELERLDQVDRQRRADRARAAEKYASSSSYLA